MIKFKNKLSYALYTLLAVVLCSCSEKLEEGTIVNKFYEAPRSYLTTEYNVALKMAMTTRRYDDEDYVFIISDIIEGDTIIDRIEVSYKTYGLYEIGDYIKLK